jgi:MFS family permease
MVAALFVTYFTVLGAKCSLPSTIPLLPAALAYPPGTDPSAALSHLLTASTLSIVCGKVVLGPLIDWVGGVRSLQIALVVLLSSLLCISTTSSFYPTFFVAWCLVDLTFSACWAAALSAVHETLDEKEWAGTVGLLAMGARLGNAAAFSGFAAILAYGERIGYGARDGGGGSGSWRAVFAAAAAVQAISLVLLSAFGRNKTRATRGHAQLGEMIAEQEGAPSPPPSSSVRKSLWLLGSVASTPQFWLHGISRSALTVVASFLLFVPSLMSQCFGLTDGAAAGVGSLYAAGCLVGVGVGSQRWYANQVPGRSRAAAVATQLGTVVATSLLLMLHVGGGLTLPAPAGALLLFLYAVGFAVPFYLPPSLYALEVGGGTSSATIADAFDIGGFSLLAAFNGYVGRIVGGGRGKMGAAGAAADSKDWIPAFVILTFCALASMASLIWATLLDAREVRGIGVEGA